MKSGGAKTSTRATASFLRSPHRSKMAARIKREGCAPEKYPPFKKQVDERFYTVAYSEGNATIWPRNEKTKGICDARWHGKKMVRSGHIIRGDNLYSTVDGQDLPDERQKEEKYTGCGVQCHEWRRGLWLRICKFRHLASSDISVMKTKLVPPVTGGKREWWNVRKPF